MVNLLEKLQSADQSVKKRWTVIISTIVMAGVLFVWIWYFNNLIASFNPEPVSAEESEQPPFPVIMKRGAAMISGEIMGQARRLSEKLATPRSYLVGSEGK